MIPYWILFIIPAVLTLLRWQPTGRRGASWPFVWQLLFVLFVLIIGLRDNVGADWEAYSQMLDFARTQTFQDALLRGGDPAYSLLNWLAVNSSLGIYFVNAICAAIFVWGLFAFCLEQPRPMLALTISVPYLVIVVAMGYTRQGTAIGLSMLGLVELAKQKFARFLVFLILATLFHKSAMVLLPLGLMVDNKNKILFFSILAMFTVVLYVLLLQEAMAWVMELYFENQYNSSGAAVRIAMNTIPAVFFLMFRKHFIMTIRQKTIWTIMSIIALSFIGILLVSPSSTAVDRIALYLIPIQLVIFSRFPDSIGKTVRAKFIYEIIVVAYSASILLVWLVLGDYSSQWLPYRFYFGLY